MKQFFKYVLATIVGLIIFGAIMSLLSVITLIGMASMPSTGGSIKNNSVLVLKLEGSLEERSQDNPFGQLFGNSLVSSQGLEDIQAAIKRAETEKNIKGIYIEAGSFAGATPASLEELRNALVKFKKTGKFIVAYGDQYTQGTYYLSSVADSILVNPSGIVEWSGMSLSSMYYKDLLDKVGVHMQVFKVGTYKSAVEPYLLNEMSEANKEQMTVFSGEIWDKLTADVSKSRKLSVEKLNALADSAIVFADPVQYKKSGLVDKLTYSDDVPNVIANMMKVDKDSYNTVSVTTLANIASSEPKGTSGNIIAVYYADGEIVDEISSSVMNRGSQIVGKKTIEDLKKLADDDDVKAVVLRVNSPGGSAYASEQIWHQVMNIKSKKPIIVSMGGYAASGGYYISCAADWIVAEPTTLTGSIGIFGMFPEASELMNKKLGLHISTVKTNEYADFGQLSRPMNEGEKAVLQSYINRGYELFTKRCADGRKISQDSIKVIGEGRVWTGVHAKQIGLVDQLGNLEDAIAVAQKKANIKEYTVLSYPAKPSIFDNFMRQATGDSYADKKMKEVFGEYYDMFNNVKNISSKTGIQASLPYYLMFNL